MMAEKKKYKGEKTKLRKSCRRKKVMKNIRKSRITGRTAWRLQRGNYSQAGRKA